MRFYNVSIGGHIAGSVCVGHPHYRMPDAIAQTLENGLPLMLYRSYRDRHEYRGRTPDRDAMSRQFAQENHNPAILQWLERNGFTHYPEGSADASPVVIDPLIYRHAVDFVIGLTAPIN